MPKILIEATFYVRYEQTITKSQLKKLNDGVPVEEVVDVECDGYRRLGTEGDLDNVDWDLVRRPAKKKGSKKR